MMNFIQSLIQNLNNLQDQIYYDYGLNLSKNKYYIQIQQLLKDENEKIEKQQVNDQYTDDEQYHNMIGDLKINMNLLGEYKDQIEYIKEQNQLIEQLTLQNENFRNIEPSFKLPKQKRHKCIQQMEVMVQDNRKLLSRIQKIFQSRINYSEESSHSYFDSIQDRNIIQSIDRIDEQIQEITFELQNLIK